MKTLLAAAQRCGLLLTLAGTVFAAAAAPVLLAPALPGQFNAGTGVDATFLKVSNSWQQSTVLWNEATQAYGSGAAISSYNWGTGLWGIADWNTANLSPTAGMIEYGWSGRVGQIGFGDDVYNYTYGATWGTVDLAPLFTPGSPQPTQDNWTSRFSGYIRVSEAGLYNFSVLHDDGFFLRLGGAGQTLTIENDYLNARDRVGFDNDLQLAVGLYALELGAYERLEAGVVELSWMRDGGAWSPVPTANLLATSDVKQVPEPSSMALLFIGLMALRTATSRRRHLRQ